jgi:hypothetical protein
VLASLATRFTNLNEHITELAVPEIVQCLRALGEVTVFNGSIDVPDGVIHLAENPKLRQGLVARQIPIRSWNKVGELIEFAEDKLASVPDLVTESSLYEL